MLLVMMASLHAICMFLSFLRFRVLFGMDWLFENNNILDCVERSVVLKDKRGQSIEILCKEPSLLLCSFLYSLDEA